MKITWKSMKTNWKSMKINGNHDRNFSDNFENLDLKIFSKTQKNENLKSKLGAEIFFDYGKIEKALFLLFKNKILAL